jgi:hypothetical protein
MFCLDSNGCLKGDRGGSLGNGPFPSVKIHFTRLILLLLLHGHE